MKEQERTRMNKLTVFQICSTLLGISEVVSLLKNPPEDGVSILSLAKPRAGKVYIYRSEKETKLAVLLVPL